MLKNAACFRISHLQSHSESAKIPGLALYCLECQNFERLDESRITAYLLEVFVNLKPLGDRVVVEHVEQQDMSSGGVFLPDTAKEKPQEGTVRAVGTGRTLDNGTKLSMDVKVGDRIIYSKYSGSEVKVDGKEYLIISEKDVLAIVDKVPAGV
jgi:chaperonin GroES